MKQSLPIIAVCPRCGSTPVGGPATWTCPGCPTTYRGLRGIIDLRTTEDEYLSNADDWAYASKLDAAFDRLDFRGLLGLYFELSPEITPALRDRQITHILTAPGRVRAWLDALGEAGNGRSIDQFCAIRTPHPSPPPQAGRGPENEVDPLASDSLPPCGGGLGWGGDDLAGSEIVGTSSGPLLDLGCGSGSFLASVGGSGRPLAGVDIAMRWLIVARKRLDEEGLSHIPLVCAGSEALPFADGTFEAVIAGDVIEHVADQGATLAEAYRVLRPGGRLFLASPNRFSLALEPHVQVWGVGFLPRRWMAPYVRWTSGRDFRAIRTLGASEWRRLLSGSPFESARIEAPGLPATDLAHFGRIKRLVARWYNRVVATRPGQALALAVGPLFHVVCERSRPVDGLAPASSPTTRPDSSLPAEPG